MGNGVRRMGNEKRRRGNGEWGMGMGNWAKLERLSKIDLEEKK